VNKGRPHKRLEKSLQHVYQALMLDTPFNNASRAYESPQRVISRYHHWSWLSTEWKTSQGL